MGGSRAPESLFHVKHPAPCWPLLATVGVREMANSSSRRRGESDTQVILLVSSEGWRWCGASAGIRNSASNGKCQRGTDSRGHDLQCPEVTPEVSPRGLARILMRVEIQKRCSPGSRTTSTRRGRSCGRWPPPRGSTLQAPMAATAGCGRLPSYGARGKDSQFWSSRFHSACSASTQSQDSLLGPSNRLVECKRAEFALTAKSGRWTYTLCGWSLKLIPGCIMTGCFMRGCSDGHRVGIPVAVHP